VTGTYANNEIGIHRVENRTESLACTLHVYAPPLRRMRIFDEVTGRVSVHLAASRSTAAVGEENYHGQGYDPSFDIDAWNAYHKYFSLDGDGDEVGAGDGLSGGHGLPTKEGHRSTC
jgi:hypothetical protein